MQTPHLPGSNHRPEVTLKKKQKFFLIKELVSWKHPESFNLAVLEVGCFLIAQTAV